MIKLKPPPPPRPSSSRFPRFQWLEDRQNVAYQSPTCMVPQLSALTSSSVSSSGDKITAVWTRPIELNTTLHTAGYLDIPAGARGTPPPTHTHTTSCAQLHPIPAPAQARRRSLRLS